MQRRVERSPVQSKPAVFSLRPGTTQALSSLFMNIIIGRAGRFAAGQCHPLPGVRNHSRKPDPPLWIVKTVSTRAATFLMVA